MMSLPPSLPGYGGFEDLGWWFRAKGGGHDA
jgi:hypothetical protein